MHYLCEEYYKPTTVQYSIADYVTWVPRLTLDLETKGTYECALRTELVHMLGTYCYWEKKQLYHLTTFTFPSYPGVVSPLAME